MSTVGRNDACPCGSGRKYKKCCLVAQPALTAQPALAAQPVPVDGPLQVAAQHIAAGRLPEADLMLQRLFVEHPLHPDVLHLSGQVALRSGDIDRALGLLRQAIGIAPRNPAYHNSLGVALGQRSQPAEALASFRAALAIDPQYRPGLSNLSLQLLGSGEFDAAHECLQRLLDRNPDAVDGHVSLANLLHAQGRLDEAERAYGRALALDPYNRAAHHGRAANSIYQPGRRADEVLAIARQFAARYEPALATNWHQHDNAPDPDRRLRIGYVSADFRQHSVAFFVEPLFAHHDHAQVEVYGYSTVASRDTVTERLERLADHWITAAGLDDSALAERIRSDRIDILVDLSGHTAGNRLLTFARKPAPIQITWLGYLGPTGLSSIDYRLTDHSADPPGEPAPAYGEEPLHLSRTCVCYRPLDSSPAVSGLPALRQGFVTFGSFNTPAKHNDQVIDLWSRILQALPESRLLLKGRGLDRGWLRSTTLQRFERAGIAAGRIDLQPYESDQVQHLRAYEAVDIALDPFPHNGVTTTCAALWMGVPVVALRGDRHAARMCASVLEGAGLADCIADTPAEYQAIAVALAADTARLERMRAGMRQLLAGSALLDEAGAARQVEQSFRSVWRRWCAGRS